MRSFDEFNRQCLSQGITLHPEISLAGAQTYDVSNFLNLSGFYGAMSVAGDLLDKNPRTKLANDLIPFGEQFKVDESQDFAESSLVRIINASIERVSYFPPERTFASKRQKYRTYACFEAEMKFANTFAQMLKPNEVLPEIPTRNILGYQIITGEAEEPVAVRKKLGETTVLTLADVCLNGIPYPAGSIMQVQLDRKLHKPSIDSTQGEHLRFSSSYISRMRFRRLSAFVLGAGSRENQFHGCFDYVEDENYMSSRLLRSANIEQLSEIARTALQTTTELNPKAEGQGSWARVRNLVGAG